MNKLWKIKTQQPSLNKKIFGINYESLTKLVRVGQITLSGSSTSSALGVLPNDPLRVTYPRQSLAPIVIHMASRVLCACPARINRSSRIYGTLTWIPKIIKNKKIRVSHIYYLLSFYSICSHTL